MANENVRLLTPQPKRSNQEAIKVLEEALRIAKDEDRIEAVAIAWINHSGGACTLNSHTVYAPALLGAIAVLKHRILRNLLK